MAAVVADGIEPLRLALRFAPPGIVVEYARRPPGEQKRLFHHEIDLQDALSAARVDVDALVAELVVAHAHVIGGCKVSSRQLARLVQKLADHQQQQQMRRSSTPTTPALPQADYNRVSETQLRQAKLKMDVVFQQNIVRPGEVGYVYDKQVAFQAPQQTSDWDDDDE